MVNGACSQVGCSDLASKLTDETEFSGMCTNCAWKHVLERDYPEDEPYAGLKKVAKAVMDIPVGPSDKNPPEAEPNGPYNRLKRTDGTQPDPINPSYYHGDGVMRIIEEYNLGFRLGAVVKYILRAGKKGSRKEDLAKAIWYLHREIDKGVE